MASLYALIAERYDDFFPPDPDREAFLSGLFPAGARLIDLGCATGSTAVALAKKGFFVTGVDFDEEMIAIAREKSDSFEGSIEFVAGDMAEVLRRSEKKPYDGILCLGNTLPHLDSLESIGEFLGAAARSLTPGGSLVIQMMEYEKIRRKGALVLEELVSGSITFHRSHTYDAATGDARLETVVADGSRRESSTIPLYPLTVHELGELSVQAGFGQPVFYKDWHGTPFTDDASWLVAVMKINYKET